MDCPHCGFAQPEGVECVQCQMPLGELADLLNSMDLETPRLDRTSQTNLDDIDLGPSKAERDQQDRRQQQLLLEQVKRVRLTTAPGFSGLAIRAYRGLVSSQVMVRMDAALAERMTTEPVVSLKSTRMGPDLNQALSVAIGELRLATVKADGNAVISVSINYQAGVPGGMLLTLSGTAVEVVRERRT